MSRPPSVPARSDNDKVVEVPVSQESQTAITNPQSIALSDQSLSQRVRQLVVWHMGEYVKNDFTYSVIGALILGALTVIDGSVTPSTVFWALMGFLAVFVGRFMWHGIQASGEIDSVIRGKIRELERAVEPKLTIHFNPDSKPNVTPYYETYDGHDGQTWELYRIAVTSTVSTSVWLKVRQVRLHENRRYNVPMRYMGAEHRVIRVEMAKDEPEYWDIAEKGADMEYALLTHVKAQYGFLMSAPGEPLEIIASAREGPVTIATIRVNIDEDKRLVIDFAPV